jgi:iron complex transport system permease protein
MNQGSAPARRAGLAVLLIVLLLAIAASLMVGARSIAPGTVLSALLHGGAGTDAQIVRDLRLPRTMVGITVGAAVAAAGALMQAVTRNPLADPGLLGVSAGSSAAVVVAIGVFGIGSATGYVWFAIAGAALASAVVYALGGAAPAGGDAATPIRLALAGTAVTAALLSVVRAVTVLDPATFDTFRFWIVGSLSGRSVSVLVQVGPLVLAGLVLAALLSRPLNTLALGAELAGALGARPGRTRAAGALAVVLLSGGATAAAGPIAFVGLVVPHAVRAFTGPDQRWVLAYSVVAGPILLLLADVAGRVVAPPGEIPVAVCTAVIGAPVFIALVRRRVVRL